VTVHGITVEPNMGSQILFVFGSRTNQNNEKIGVIVQLNFTSLQERKCSLDNDYELWSPRDILSDDVPCILGETLVFRRRKRDSTCHNGADFEVLVSEIKCPCSRQDFECDYCYEQDVYGQCVPSTIDGCSARSTKPPPICTSVYTISKGYRYVPGTKCDPNGKGSVSRLYAPTTLTCPGVTLTSATTPRTSSINPRPSQNPTVKITTQNTQVLPSSTVDTPGVDSNNSGGSNKGVVAAVVIIVLLVIVGGAAGIVFFLVKTKRIDLGPRWVGLFGKPKPSEHTNVSLLSDF